LLLWKIGSQYRDGNVHLINTEYGGYKMHNTNNKHIPVILLGLFLLAGLSEVAFATSGSITVRDSSGRMQATLEADGDVRNAGGAKIGSISLSGDVRGQSGQSIGRVDTQGTVRDSAGRKLGSIDDKGHMRDASGRLRGTIADGGQYRDAAGRSRLSFNPYLPDARLRAAAYIWFFTAEISS